MGKCYKNFAPKIINLWQNAKFFPQGVGKTMLRMTQKTRHPVWGCRKKNKTSRELYASGRVAEKIVKPSLRSYVNSPCIVSIAFLAKNRPRPELVSEGLPETNGAKTS